MIFLLLNLRPQLNTLKFMKKVFLLFVLGATFAVSQAQVKFGAKAGLNIATLTGEDIEDVKSKLGFNVGAFAEIPVSDNFSVKPEVVYSDQGAKMEGEGDAKYNLGYVNIPVLAKYTSTSGFFGETGPQLGILASAKVKYDGGSVDYKDQTKSIDFAWAFGVGYQLEQGFGFNARYNLGLASIADGEGDATVKNGVFQVGVFYTFGGSASTASR